MLEEALKAEAEFVGEMGAKILTIKEAEPHFANILFHARIGSRITPHGELLTQAVKRMKRQISSEVLDQEEAEYYGIPRLVVALAEPRADDGEYGKRQREMREWTARHIKKEAAKIVGYKNGKIPKNREKRLENFTKAFLRSRAKESSDRGMVRKGDLNGHDPSDNGMINYGHDTSLDSVNYWKALEMWKKQKFDYLSLVEYLSMEARENNGGRLDFLMPNQYDNHYGYYTRQIVLFPSK
jgi:hypothetical protein